ncbi:hypothetical protein GDO81_023717 [Engystomops pustulosus]|uniref:Regulator of microtubule dynamics protein 2 n=1 Tax=Engystomops pustulosus TaxID=76066 RepID=A0AAV6ZST0_ENGPU|nr:hypothetical protein GDO81_023717 [Engystomops pustulosus]
MSNIVQSENRSLLLGVFTGAAGVSIAFLCWRRYGKHGYFLGLPEKWSSTRDNQVQNNQGAVMVLQGRQLQILEKLGSLLKSVEELREEVKFLKETIPKLEEQIKDELRGKNDGRKVSPQHRSLKRKKSETTKASGEYPSSEEAESEGGYAIMCGYMSEYENVQNKIKNGYLFKEHLDKAIQLQPEDPLQYYLLGRWCYAVSQLSWIERKVAATLFGNPPTATVQEALQNFLKAEEMHPGYSKYNYVFLAKCYKDLGQKVLALKYCNEASCMPSVTKEVRIVGNIWLT